MKTAIPTTRRLIRDSIVQVPSTGSHLPDEAVNCDHAGGSA